MYIHLKFDIPIRENEWKVTPVNNEFGRTVVKFFNKTGNGKTETLIRVDFTEVLSPFKLLEIFKGFLVSNGVNLLTNSMVAIRAAFNIAYCIPDLR